MSDHHVGHLLRIGFFRNHLADVFALPEYNDTVRYILDLMELVRDDDNGFARLTHIP